MSNTRSLSARLLAAGFGLFAATLTLHLAFAGEMAKAYHAPASDVMVLPQYCWAQYILDVPDTPPYIISKDLCGIGTNHLCDGYIQVRRAKKKWSDAAYRGGELWGAKGSFEYTLTAIKNFPNCPIRGDAEKALAEVKELLTLSKH